MDTALHTTRIPEIPNDVFYVECSLEPGMTIDAFRRSRPRRPNRWERLRQFGGRG